MGCYGSTHWGPQKYGPLVKYAPKINIKDFNPISQIFWKAFRYTGLSRWRYIYINRNTCIYTCIISFLSVPSVKGIIGKRLLLARADSINGWHVTSLSEARWSERFTSLAGNTIRSAHHHRAWGTTESYSSPSLTILNHQWLNHP